MWNPENREYQLSWSREPLVHIGPEVWRAPGDLSPRKQKSGSDKLQCDKVEKMEKAMAPHSSTLAWKIPRMEEPGGLQFMGSLRVGHDWDFTFTFHFHALEKAMATHSSVLAWRIPGTGEPGGLPSLGSHRVGHDKQLSSSSSRVGKGNQTCLPFSVYGITFTFPWYGWWFSPDGLSLPF